MFDANAAHIPIGEKFFAEVHETNLQLRQMGIEVDDIVLCQHVKKSGHRSRTIDHTLIWINFNEEPVGYYDSAKGDEWAWLVYSGRMDGTGFICDGWKLAALEFLGGEWKECDRVRRRLPSLV